MKEKTVLEIGKICLNVTTFEGSPEYNVIALEWTEQSSYCLYPDNDESIDIDRETAIKLIDVLTEHFKL